MRAVRIALTFLLVLLCGLSGAAQYSAPGANDPHRQRIYFSALTREEKPRLGLTPNDFRFQVNGRNATMEGFRAGQPQTDRSRPLAAWILLDFSPHVDSRLISDQADAAARLFDLLHPDSAVGVQIISDRAEILAPLRHDPEALRKAFVQFGGSRRELKAGHQGNTVLVGPAGILAAIDLAITDVNNFALSEPSLKDKETMRAVIIVSPANVNPAYNRRSLADKSNRHGIFLYPVFVPGPIFGPWVNDYFDLARQTGGVAAVFGALIPGPNIFKLQRPTLGPGALSFNFIHVVRDISGKYSFAAPIVPPGGKLELELKCLKKDVRIRLPRKELP